METFTKIYHFHVPTYTIKFHHIRDRYPMNIQKLSALDILSKSNDIPKSNIPYMDTSCDHHSQR